MRVGVALSFFFFAFRRITLAAIFRALAAVLRRTSSQVLHPIIVSSTRAL